jgi:hypothetical protein
MNEKLAKFLVKTALSIGVSAVIGYMIKAEKEIENRIDEHYETNEQ